jgi:hypothetical protein
VLLVTGAVAVVVVGAILGYRAWRDDDTDSGAVPPTDATNEPTTEPDAEAPEHRMFTRVTDAGIELRVDRADEDLGFGFPGAPDGVPEFCRVIGQVVAVAISDEEVLQGFLPLTAELAPEPGPTMLGGMFGPAAADIVGFVVQVPPDALGVRLVAPGASDEMAPVDGVAALAVRAPGAAFGDDGPGGGDDGFVPGGPPTFDDVTLSIEHSTGAVQHVRGDDLVMGPVIWRGNECMEPPPATPPNESDDPEENPFAVHLPPPGEQPPDPDAARADIVAAVDALYGADETVDVLALVDDPFAMRETFEQMREIGAADFEQAAVEIEELVFLSPVEAAFEYTLDVGDGLVRDEQFGRARLVDGTWRIGRGTICRDLQQNYGTNCPP